MSYNDLIKKWNQKVESITEKYSKEIKEYEKIGNNENFQKIIKKIEELGKYKVELDKHTSLESQMYGINKIENEYIKIHFSFFDFYGFDTEFDMKKYLNGGKYNLDAYFDEEFIEYEMLKGGYESFDEIKKIIDEVIKRNEKNRYRKH